MAIVMFTALLICSLAVGSAVATGTKHDPRDGSVYDYVVVGGGISGLVVANRLTEDRRSKPSAAVWIV
jgi:ribulose 1,5-bisphosphate synthetase/thiazole synthase